MQGKFHLKGARGDTFLREKAATLENGVTIGRLLAAVGGDGRVRQAQSGGLKNEYHKENMGCWCDRASSQDTETARCT